MKYFLDTNSFRLLEAYYPQNFPTFWARFDNSVQNDDVGSVREVWKEIQNGSPAPHILSWTKKHKGVFVTPGEDVLGAVASILSVRKFQQMVGRKQILRGTPVADPFLVGAAMASGGCVVTEERDKPNSAKIPTVCSYYGIQCVNLQEMMKALRWSF